MNFIKCILTIFISTFTFAQTVYEIQPGSKGNLFELGFTNTGSTTEQSITVLLQDKPDWVSFAKEKVVLEQISSGEKQFSKFYFDVSENAPLGEEGTIIFTISKRNGGAFTKTYNVKVTAPTVFELNQNYPNPFNPSTTIKYSIPQDAFVSLKVFNVLGESVTELVGKDIKTGIHEVAFDATNFSSGFYFYVVEAKGVDGTKYFDSKKMILLK